MVDAAQSLMWVSAELGPEAQVGGLGDVVRTLPPLFAEAGLRVTVAVPGHRMFGRRPVVKTYEVCGYRFDVESATRNGVRVCLFRCDPLFDRPGVYGGVDEDAWRFGLFSRAALMFAVDEGIGIVHAHDWQTGFVPVLAKHFKLPLKTVMTVHNVAYQGVVGASVVPALGIAWDGATDAGLGFGWGRVNLLKGGVLAAKVVTTVSRTHARDICTKEGGFGLDGVFRDCKPRGICNGIDTRLWNPGDDKALAAHAPAADWKQKNRAALYAKLAWPKSPRPLVVSVGRLVEQKGIDLLIVCAYIERAFDFFIVGSGDQHTESELRLLSAARPERVRTVIAYDEALSRLAFAAADFFAMPSRFEPAGLAQLQAQHYGAIPIVRRTGGLADTVTDMGDPGGNGICFADATVPSLSHAFLRARELYADEQAFSALREAALAARVDWRDRLPEFLALYRDL